MHLPSGLQRRYKSIQSQSQSQVLGRAGNSGGPRAGNRATPSLYFIPVPFLRAGEAIPGWSRPRLSLALSEEVLDFPFPCFCLCLPCPTRMRRQLKGIWVEMSSFPDIFLDVTFSKPFLYPVPAPGSAWPRGRSLPAHPDPRGFLVVFLQGETSVGSASHPASPVHPHSEYSMFAGELEPLESLFQGFSVPSRGWLGTFGSDC